MGRRGNIQGGRTLTQLTAGFAALAVVGLAGCTSDQAAPGIDPQTTGPLSAEEAELLIEAPFSDLLDSLSRVAGDESEVHMTSGGVAPDQGRCLWSSPMHAWTADMAEDTWDELAEEVRPSVKAWEMDDDLLDRAERSAGAGLVAESPYNGARLEVQGWNPAAEGDDPPAEPGQQDGFSLVVTVPLDPAECD